MRLACGRRCSPGVWRGRRTESVYKARAFCSTLCSVFPSTLHAIMVKSASASSSPRRQPYGKSSAGGNNNNNRLPNAVLLVSSLYIEDGDLTNSFVPLMFKVHVDDLSELPALQKQLHRLTQETCVGYYGIQNMESLTLLPAVFNKDGSLSQLSQLMIAGVNTTIKNDPIPDTWEQTELQGHTLCGKKLGEFASAANDMISKNNVSWDAFTLEGLALFLCQAADKPTPNWVNDRKVASNEFIAKHLSVYSTDKVEAAYMGLRFQ